MSRKTIRVLVVDDSALIRNVMSEILSEDPEIEVVGTAPDPYVARDKIKALNPDVLTLDVEMPKMDGLTFLQKLMAARPMPVVMVSSLTEQGAATTLQALESGAVDFVTKPTVDIQHGLSDLAFQIVQKVKTAAQASVKKRTLPVDCAERIKALAAQSAMIKTTDTIIAIGASTGGTEALRELLEVLPPNTPPIVMTQHMPERFTKSFADRLNQLCQIQVKEAQEGDSVIPGQALLAPGNYHMELRRSGARYYVSLNQGPPINRHRPSVDAMFRSVAHYAGGNSLGVILTGMGNDGAAGMLEMKQAGAFNIAQDEASCVVFGMPKEAIKAGGVDKILPLSEIPGALLSQLKMLSSR
ncbi:MAG: chemotaxis response regulator protein-glutamate methylesterase [Nitrospira sp.]|nr:chemotaxis response regulator protein-glutamate methylesterase [Nitrospira sp.]MCA9475840.1 chemotaxis response regulator protein-glutamate methylesterase [Nitrospira sp.]MCA9481269.1 chemotaxis response regulator protein-glutamate methylesterase [Nitrospira sp.]MCB9711396.1 chemotaxis response regulator protein-glutamate methylesterase [Nitrospiraceae bacterium]MDR4486286.1 chemotaxis response regulator protein-glutamate methylesterase [Nitrospirales bacterium]